METIDNDITSISEVRNEYKFLKKTDISNFTGFLRDKSIFVNIRTPKGKPYLIRYSIKSKYLYYEFRKCLQKLTNMGGI